MSNQEFIQMCKEKVAQYFNAKKEKTDAEPASGAYDDD